MCWSHLVPQDREASRAVPVEGRRNVLDVGAYCCARSILESPFGQRIHEAPLLPLDPRSELRSMPSQLDEVGPLLPSRPSATAAQPTPELNASVYKREGPKS